MHIHIYCRIDPGERVRVPGPAIKAGNGYPDTRNKRLLKQNTKSIIGHNICLKNRFHPLN